MDEVRRGDVPIPGEIRRCTGQDAPALRDIAQKTFCETFAHLNTEADMRAYLEGHLSLSQLSAELANSNSAFYLLEVDGAPAAYMKLNEGNAQTEPKGDDCLEVERIYCLAAYQGKGLGRALMDFAVATARAKEKKAVWLGVWEHNEKALRFYGKNGFVTVGQHAFVLGTDEQIDLLMQKDLD